MDMTNGMGLPERSWVLGGGRKRGKIGTTEITYSIKYNKKKDNASYYNFRFC